MSKCNFNEATRVQLTALLHLMRLGYTYVGMFPRGVTGYYDSDTNILTSIFERQFKLLDLDTKYSAESVLADIRKELDDDDLGRRFYKSLVSVSPYRLVDFGHPRNKSLTSPLALRDKLLPLLMNGQVTIK